MQEGTLTLLLEMAERGRAEVAAASPRPAEEIAREMVPEPRESETFPGFGVSVALAECRAEIPGKLTLKTAREFVDGLRSIIVSAITQARADGAAAALAGQQPCDLASAGRATNCGTCAAALTEEPHRPDCTEPRAIVERGRVSTLVRASRRWAAVARKTGGAADEQIAADIDLVEAVEAFDAAQPGDLAGRIKALEAHVEEEEASVARSRRLDPDADVSTGKVRIWKAMGAIAELREMQAAGVARPNARPPRDLAGRIRAMILRWSDIWASLGLWDAQTDAAVRFCLEALREAERCARRCPDQRSAAQIVSALRACAREAHDTTKPIYVQAADELEAIVRGGEPPGARTACGGAL